MLSRHHFTFICQMSSGKRGPISIHLVSSFRKCALNQIVIRPNELGFASFDMNGHNVVNVLQNKQSGGFSSI